MVVIPVMPMTRATTPPHEAVEARTMRASRRFTEDLLSSSSEVKLGDKARGVNPKGEKLRGGAVPMTTEAHFHP